MSIKTVAQIKTSIKSIQTRGATLFAAVQDTGIDVLKHVDAHGDVTLVNDLYKALGDGMRTAAFSAWVMAYGKVKANTGKNKVEMPFVFDKAKVTDIEQAMVNKWYTCGAPEKSPDEVYDLAAALNRIIKQATKPDAKLPKSVTPELIAQLKTLASAATPTVPAVH